MSGFRTFLRLCLGESLSALGTQLTGFTLAVWALRQTESVSWYAAFALATAAPRLLLAPVAGVLVDRHDRRRVLLFGHAASGLCTLGLAALFVGGVESPALVLSLVALSSLLSAGQYPAFQAATTLLVDKASLPRANGFVHLGLSLAHTVAPVAAGASMARLGIVGVIAIDALTFSLACVLLMGIRIPPPPSSPSTPSTSSDRSRATDFGQLAFGWHFVRDRPSLLAFLLLFTALNFCLGMSQVLLGPLVLAMADEKAMGLVLGQAGLGLVLGSLAMTLWGGPRRLVPTITALALLQGLALGATALGRAPTWIGIGALATFFTRPLLSACSATLWQRKVAPAVQGRVFAFRSAIVQGVLPLAYVLAGPASDALFEPAMLPGALGARLFGSALGTGPGRGIALLIVVLACGILGAALVSRLHPSLWHLEARLPDPVSRAP